MKLITNNRIMNLNDPALAQRLSHLILLLPPGIAGIIVGHPFDTVKVSDTVKLTSLEVSCARLGSPATTRLGWCGDEISWNDSLFF